MKEKAFFHRFWVQSKYRFIFSWLRCGAVWCVALYCRVIDRVDTRWRCRCRRWTWRWFWIQQRRQIYPEHQWEGSATFSFTLVWSHQKHTPHFDTGSLCIHSTPRQPHTVCQLGSLHYSSKADSQVQIILMHTWFHLYFISLAVAVPFVIVSHFLLATSVRSAFG